MAPVCLSAVVFMFPKVKKQYVMKKQATHGKETLVKHIANKGLVSKLDKEFLKLNN